LSLAAKEAIGTTPIVFAAVADAVGSGLVASLARPGGNVTGLSFLGPDIVGKHLQLLKEAVPRVTSVSVLSHPANPSEATRKIMLKEAEAAARALAMRLQFFEARGPDDFDGAFAKMIRAHADAVTVLTSIMFYRERKRLVDTAAKYRIPAMYPWREPVDAGGFMSYGANIPDLFRRAAYFVDRILKESRAGDLPVEQPTKFDLVINLKTAKALGLTIPQSILVRADEIIQ
jgi:putative ABC transport system substrate-binding protein